MIFGEKIHVLTSKTDSATKTSLMAGIG